MIVYPGAFYYPKEDELFVLLHEANNVHRPLRKKLYGEHKECAILYEGNQPFAIVYRYVTTGIDMALVPESIRSITKQLIVTCLRKSKLYIPSQITSQHLFENCNELSLAPQTLGALFHGIIRGLTSF